MKTPSFWYQKNQTLLAFLLWPIGIIYGAIVALRQLIAMPYHAKISVICVGNFTIGGGGKTPIVDALSALFLKKNINICILSRGYKGKLKGPVFVDPIFHDASDVGDEPLMLARKGYRVCVAKSKVEGTKFIESQNDFNAILMDDGLQNPTLHKDFKICVIKENLGFGNGLVFPAGPLRECVNNKKKRTIDQFIIWQSHKKNDLELPADHTIKTSYKILGQYKKNQKYLAFSGIAHPSHFFEVLEMQGVNLVEKISFSDHYSFTRHDLNHLSDLAKDFHATLITTEKDAARIDKKILNSLGIEIFQIAVDDRFEKKIWPVLEKKVFGNA